MKPGTQPSGGCPIGWTCNGIAYADFYPVDTNPVVKQHALGCCSQGASLPVTFHSIIDVFDWWNVDYADFDWDCVRTH